MATETATAGLPEFRSAGEVLGAIESAMKFLAGVDMAQLPGEVLAQILTSMEQVDAGQAAVRGRAVSVFSAKQVQCEYALRAVPGWLVRYTRVRKAQARAVRRLGFLHEVHPVLTAALAEQDVVSESVAVQIAKWTDRLPEDCVQAADEILVQACRAGADERLLADLAAQIRIRVCGPDPEVEDDKLIDRSLRLERTLGGAGVLRAGLTPECAAVLQAVLDAFGQRQGPEDDRRHEQRMHDALQKACETILGTDRVPKKHEKPYTAVVHVPFAHLLDLPAASVLVEAYTGHLTVAWQDQAAQDGGWADRVSEWQDDAHAEWAGHRAAGTVTGGDRGTWLDADQALRILPDAMIMPVVTTRLAVGYLQAIVEIGAEIHHLEREHATAPAGELAVRAERMAGLRQDLIAKAIALVSGPDALASYLRRTLLGSEAAGPLGGVLGAKSLVLDVGDRKDIPYQIRLAVNVRSQTCQVRGCDQPAWKCEPHHLRHREHGGLTSLTNLENLCWWHHHVLIHGKGWSARLNGDGTLTLRKPDGTSLPNGPPLRPG
jgi:Domain of unknown function (DUF222)